MTPECITSLTFEVRPEGTSIRADGRLIWRADAGAIERWSRYFKLRTPWSEIKELEDNNLVETLGKELLKNQPNYAVCTLMFVDGKTYTFKVEGVNLINHNGQIVLRVPRPIRVVEEE